MKPDRFAAELPQLFDDFPRSEHPRGRRFDDIVETVPNLARENNLALVNLAVSLLEPGESYVEAGTYRGASLIAAGRDNDSAELVGIDNFSFGETRFEGRELPAANRAETEANLARFGVSARLVEGDVLEVLPSFSGDPVGVFYYDACHATDVTLGALRLVEPHLAEPALVIVDDTDWDRVREAVDAYLAEQPRVRRLFDIAGSDRGQPWWWEGMTVLAWA